MFLNNEFLYTRSQKFLLYTKATISCMYKLPDNKVAHGNYSVRSLTRLILQTQVCRCQAQHLCISHARLMIEPKNGKKLSMLTKWWSNKKRDTRQNEHKVYHLLQTVLDTKRTLSNCWPKIHLSLQESTMIIWYQA